MADDPLLAQNADFHKNRERLMRLLEAAKGALVSSVCCAVLRACFFVLVSVLVFVHRRKVCYAASLCICMCFSVCLFVLCVCACVSVCGYPDGDVPAFNRAVELIALETSTSEPDVVKGFKDGAGRSALHFAANFGHNALCEAILGAAPECVIGRAGTRVVLVLLTLLVVVCSALHNKDDDGATALHLATLGNRPEVVTLLLERGADVNAVQTSDKRSALHIAAEQDYPEVRPARCVFTMPRSPMHGPVLCRSLRRC